MVSLWQLNEFLQETETFAQDAISKCVLSAHDHVLPSAAYLLKAGPNKSLTLTEMPSFSLTVPSQIVESVKCPGLFTLAMYKVSF